MQVEADPATQTQVQGQNNAAAAAVAAPRRLSRKTELFILRVSVVLTFVLFPSALLFTDLEITSNTSDRWLISVTLFASYALGALGLACILCLVQNAMARATNCFRTPFSQLLFFLAAWFANPLLVLSAGVIGEARVLKEMSAMPLGLVILMGAGKQRLFEPDTNHEFGVRADFVAWLSSRLLLIIFPAALISFQLQLYTDAIDNVRTPVEVSESLGLGVGVSTLMLVKFFVGVVVFGRDVQDGMAARCWIFRPKMVVRTLQMATTSLVLLADWIALAMLMGPEKPEEKPMFSPLAYRWVMFSLSLVIAFNLLGISFIKAREDPPRGSLVTCLIELITRLGRRGRGRTGGWRPNEPDPGPNPNSIFLASPEPFLHRGAREISEDLVKLEDFTKKDVAIDVEEGGGGILLNNSESTSHNPHFNHGKQVMKAVPDEVIAMEGGAEPLLSPAKKTDSSMGDLRCTICFEEFAEGEMIRRMPECEHIYHSECLVKWAKQQKGGTVCPMCRAPAFYPQGDVQDSLAYIQAQHLYQAPSEEERKLLMKRAKPLTEFGIHIFLATLAVRLLENDVQAAAHILLEHRRMLEKLTKQARKNICDANEDDKIHTARLTWVEGVKEQNATLDDDVRPGIMFQLENIKFDPKMVAIPWKELDAQGKSRVLTLVMSDLIKRLADE